MGGITRREAALIHNLSAPLGADVPVPPRRAKATTEREWKLQAAAVKATRERMRYDKDLWYEVNLIENARTPARAAMAKMMGMQRGPNDMTLYRRFPHGIQPSYMKVLRIEFKLPKGQLTAEQLDWFAFHSSAGIRCERVDNLGDFVKLLDGF